MRAALLTTLTVQFFLWLWVSRWMYFVTAAGFPFYALAMAALNGGLFVWLFRLVHVSRRDDTESAQPRAVARLPMTVTLPVIWVAVESLRGELLFDGYPWYFLSHPLVESTIFAQSADLFGAYFISFLAAMISGALLDVLRARSGECAPRCAAIASCAAIALLTANILYGTWRMRQTDSLTEGPSILLVQTNLPQDNKMRWSAEDMARDFTSFLNLTIEAVQSERERGRPIDLIVWPETMLPGMGLEMETLEYLEQHGYEMHHFGREIIAFSRRLNIPMLVGSPAVLGLGTREVVIDGRPMVEWTWEKQYNSAYLIEGNLPFQRYDKVFLTPFGETMPYISNWPALEERLLAIGAHGMSFDLDKGDEPRVLTLPWRGGEVGLATPICFEVTVGWLNRKLVYHNGEKRADVLVNVTNDGWFGFHGAGRVQHAQISRYRAIENRVPMVRSANTGVSVSIDSAGRVIAAIGDGSYGEPKRDGFLYTTVTLDRRHTLYGRIGDLWAWLCIAATVLLLCAAWMRAAKT